VELKHFTIQGMRAIIDTINSIDENSKKIVFKHFDQQHVNILAKEAPYVISNLQRIQAFAQKYD